MKLEKDKEPTHHIDLKKKKKENLKINNILGEKMTFSKLLKKDHLKHNSYKII
jgi:hypothetical protein